MNILLTFTGFHDPYSKGLLGEEEQPGPILSLVAARPFDKIILFSTPATDEITDKTREALNQLHPSINIDTLSVPLDDPTDYADILSGLRQHIRPIQEGHASACFYIAVASGTPQMHACWVLLAAAGEIPARLLNIRPPRFVTRTYPLIGEIDVTGAEFPSVRCRLGTCAESGNDGIDIDMAISQLGIVGDHPKMKSALEMGAMLAPSRAPILILGETGTGKELLARFVHHLSGRQKESFVPVNCAAIPEGLVESLLFGHRKGSFTGALTDQAGKFDAAHKGTLFLDEIGEMPLSTQAKFLRVLQDGLIEPLGATDAHAVDVRIIAATNRDLRKLMTKGKFREDLYYRLQVGEVRIPALRDRRSDIPKTALFVLDKINRSLRSPKKLSPRALARLQGHNWPGNVREMENMIERSALLCRHDVIDDDDLILVEGPACADPFDSLPVPYEGFSMNGFLDSVRKQLFLRALEAANGNQSKAAKMLGISGPAVHKFLQGPKEEE